MLAAGSATRFGSDKLQHALPHGVSIAVQSARHLKPELGRVVAVVRPGSDELSKALKSEGCEIVVCENAAEGLGASLACAARTAGEADGYLIALADMPFLRRTTIAVAPTASATEHGVRRGEGRRIAEPRHVRRSVRLAQAEAWSKKPKPKVDAKPPVNIQNGADLA